MMKTKHDTLKQAIHGFDFDALHRQAVDRFENVKRLNNSFDVYDNCGIVYTFTQNGPRVTVGISTDGSGPYNFSANLFKNCLLGDVQCLFNMMQETCGKLEETER